MFNIQTLNKISAAGLSRLGDSYTVGDILRITEGPLEPVSPADSPLSVWTKLKDAEQSFFIMKPKKSWTELHAGLIELTFHGKAHLLARHIVHVTVKPEDLFLMRRCRLPDALPVRTKFPFLGLPKHRPYAVCGLKILFAQSVACPFNTHQRHVPEV